jgi:hypothetical protein
MGGDTDVRAQEKGVLLLGECGLDPGIDSMSVTPLTETLCTDEQGGNADLRSCQERRKESDFLRIMVWRST